LTVSANLAVIAILFVATNQWTCGALAIVASQAISTVICASTSNRASNAVTVGANLADVAILLGVASGQTTSAYATVTGEAFTAVVCAGAGRWTSDTLAICANLAVLTVIFGAAGYWGRTLTVSAAEAVAAVIG
jgi:hypothetical protein